MNRLVIELQNAQLSDDCRKIFRNYLGKMFPRSPMGRGFVFWSADDIYFELYSIRRDVKKRKLEELCK